MGLGEKSYVLLIFLRERLGRTIRSAVWEVFFFQFPSRFVRSLLESRWGRYGQWSLAFGSRAILSCLLATFIGAFDCTRPPLLPLLVKHEFDDVMIYVQEKLLLSCTFCTAIVRLLNTTN